MVFLLSFSSLPKSCGEWPPNGLHTAGERVPQGSILAPLLFNVYVVHLPDLVSSQQVEMPSYADDLTFYSIANSLEAAVSEATDLVTDDLHHVMYSLMLVSRARCSLAVVAAQLNLSQCFVVKTFH